jgi:hypothetical protein
MQGPMMSHMLELPDALYAALLEAADASGLTLDPTMSTEIKKTRPAVILHNGAVGILPL